MQAVSALTIDYLLENGMLHIISINGAITISPNTPLRTSVFLKITYSLFMLTDNKNLKCYF